MNFSELKEFLESKMKLVHIYQPLLIKSLVDAGGSATVRQLAGVFLVHDESQLLYYEKRLKEMPIKVLSKHGLLKRDGELVTLNVGKLTLEQKAEVRKICEQKMQEYIASRGLGIWDHRMLDDSPASDEMRLRILKEAKGRCALCGATKDERPLDIDHILSRSKGGKTGYENLQVLCSKCNRTKRNTEDTDYRQLVEADYKDGCVFCEESKDRAILENEYAVAILDGFPVSDGHTLVIPKRHFADYFDITEKEQLAVNDLIRVRRKQLLEENKTILGFNVGVNAGAAAGQTVWHCHIHLIPRRHGDTPNPRGGVRRVIPLKANYEPGK